MIIRISDAAKLDLLERCQFYENQEEKIGSYFLDSLYSDIDSLKLFAGSHRKNSDLIGCSQRHFRLRFITR